MSEEANEQIEAAAREQGWRPDGKNSDGESVSALDFLINGSKFHRSLKETVDDLKAENAKVYKIVAEHITTTGKKEYETQKANIDAELQKAKDEGDADRAAELAEQKASLREPEVVDPGAEIIDAWIKKQDWWEKQPDMRVDTTALYKAEVDKLGRDDPDTILPKVEARLQQLYPDYFQIKNPNRDTAAGDPGKSKPEKRKGLSVNDLDEDEQRHIEQFKAMGMSEEKILSSIQDLRKQRAV